MTGVIGTILVGLIVGVIARFVKPGDDKLGWIMTIVLGIAGSFVANFIGSALGIYKAGDTADWIASILGAVVLLFAYAAVKKKSDGGTGGGSGGSSV